MSVTGVAGGQTKEEGGNLLPTTHHLLPLLLLLVLRLRLRPRLLLLLLLLLLQLQLLLPAT